MGIETNIAMGRLRTNGGLKSRSTKSRTPCDTARSEIRPFFIALMSPL